MMPYLFASGVFLVGIHAVMAKRGHAKTVVGIILIQMSLILMLVLIGYRSGGEAPVVSSAAWEQVVSGAASGRAGGAAYVDPVAQALAAVLMGGSVAVTMLAVAVCTGALERRRAPGSRKSGGLGV